MGESVFRLRVCFGKRGRLRYLSHLETARALERAVRRAGLPYAVTKGFNPHMKVAFGPALPVGTAGDREYVDVWLVRHVPALEARERLTNALAPDLAPCSVAYVGDREPSLSAALSVAVYDVVVSGAGGPDGCLRAALESVLADGTLAVERKGKQKVFELASMLPKEPEVRPTAGGAVVTVTVRIGEGGSLRPEALVNAAVARSECDARVVSVTRTDLLIEDAGVTRRPL